MASIKESCIQEVRLRARIEEVVAPFVQLKRAGSQLKGLCPFHQEKTPSFHVSPDRGYFKCFGCGKAGDAFRFLMEIEHREFPEAVEILARRFGVELVYEEGRGPNAHERSLRQQLLEIHDAATAFFRETFLSRTPAGEFARTYWTDTRRFPADLADEFRIGFSPEDDRLLAAHLLQKGFPDEALRGSGLFYEREGQRGPARWRCRFRGRLMVPIRDVQDRVVAFTARQTDLTPQDDPSREAKYINSPETEIFRKSNLLFNLGRARTHVSDTQPFLLVEGQLDALRCWNAGLRTAVAPQGTAITEQQLGLLRRYCPRVECFLDGDSAGQKAALRMLPLAIKAGLEVHFLPLAPGEDPDSYFRERGAKGIDALRSAAKPALQFACERILPDGASAGAEAKSRAADTLFEIVASAESAVMQAACLRVIASHLGLGPTAVAEAFNSFQAKRPRRSAETAGESVAAAIENPGPPGNDPKPTAPRSGHVDRPEEDYLFALVAQCPALQRPVAACLPPEWIDTSTTGGRLLDRLLNEVQHGLWAENDSIDRLLENQEERDFAAQLLFDVPIPEYPDELANQQLQILTRRRLAAAIDRIDRTIASLPPDSTEELKALFSKKKQLLAKWQNPPNVTSFS